MRIDLEIIEGIFIEESKNRFIGLVQIDNHVIECYIPNSSKMGRYLRLKNKQVLLTINKKNRRTKYSLFAVKHYSSYILLNLNMVNNILEAAITNRWLFPASGYDIYKERIVGNYKTDLLLENCERKIVIEAKGIISAGKTVLFPTVYSERFTNQLLQLKQLLLAGWEVHYIFVSLSPFVKEISLDTSKQKYYSLIKNCLDLGMKTQAFSVCYQNEVVKFRNYVSIK